MTVTQSREADSRLVIGVDLGGTKVETGLVDATGRVVASHGRPTNPEGGQDAVVADIVACVKNCLGDPSSPAEALGIGVAGQVDATTGTVLFAPNLGWRNVPLKGMLEPRLGLPVAVINDVRAATWGEWRYGSGSGSNDLLVVFVGTGIGGGLVSGGQILEGCTNAAGEIGHMTLVADGRPCRCPNLGCLEAYAGGWAIAERAQEQTLANPEGAANLIALATTVEGITAATVSQAFRLGDPFARELVTETGLLLGSGIVGLVNAFNPCLLVLGGGVIEGLPDLIPLVEDTVRRRALPAVSERLRIVKAALGGHAGIVGAAAFARASLVQSDDRSVTSG